MGRLARLLSFTRRQRHGAHVTDVKVDPGGGANTTAEHFAPPGDDSHPLPGDYVAALQIPRRGGEVAVGYLDPKNAPKAGPGDKRIYSRDSAGAVKADLWLKSSGDVVVQNGAVTLTLKADGSAKVDNGSGSIELQKTGDVVINSVTIDTAGNIDTPKSLTAGVSVEAPSIKADGAEVAAHSHTYTDDGTGRNTGPLK